MKYLIIVCCMYVGVYLGGVQAQYYTHTAGIDTAQMRAALEGQGVQILNIEIKCKDETQGYYQGIGNLGIGLDSGIVLSLSDLDSVFCPFERFSNYPYVSGVPVDIGVDYISREFMVKKGIEDYVYATISCGIEFDIIPANDKIHIPYVFADVLLDSTIPPTVAPDGNWKMVTESMCHCVPHVNLMGIFVTGGSYGTDTINYGILPQDDGYGRVPVNRYTMTLDQPLFEHFCSSHETDTMFWGPIARRHYVRYNNDGYLLPNINFPGLTVPLAAEIPVTPCDTFHIAMGTAMTVPMLSGCCWGTASSTAIFVGRISSPGTADSCSTTRASSVQPHELGIYISPNPFQQRVHLESSDANAIYELRVIDILGKVRIQLRGTATALMASLNNQEISQLPAQQHYLWEFTATRTGKRSTIKMYKQ